MGHSIKKNKHDKGIGQHIESINEWEGYMGKIFCGAYTVCVDGNWMPIDEFNKKYPKPFVVNFMGDATNPDSTKNFLYR